MVVVAWDIVSLLSCSKMKRCEGGGGGWCLLFGKDKERSGEYHIRSKGEAGEGEEGREGGGGALIISSILRS